MKRFFVPVLCVILAGCISSPEKIIYPTTRMDDTVDNYYGTKVADPYRWLENQDSAETTAWIEAQNNLTFSYMDRIPEREKIRARLTELWNYPTYSTPWKEGGRYFFSKTTGFRIRQCCTCKRPHIASLRWSSTPILSAMTEP